MKKSDNIQKLLDSLYGSMRNPRNAALAIITAAICGFGAAKFTGAKSVKDKESVKTELNNQLAQQPNYSDSIKIAEEFYGAEINEAVKQWTLKYTQLVDADMQPLWDLLTPKQQKRVLYVVENHLIQQPSTENLALYKKYPAASLEDYIAEASLYEMFVNDEDTPEWFTEQDVAILHTQVPKAALNKMVHHQEINKKLYNGSSGVNLSGAANAVIHYYVEEIQPELVPYASEIESLKATKGKKISKFEQAQKSLTKSAKPSVNYNDGR